MQQQWLAGGKLQIKFKFSRLDACAVHAGGGAALQCPVAQFDLRVKLSCLRYAKACACDALVVPELFALHIGDGAVGKQQLFGCKLRLHVLCGFNARAKKRDLKAYVAAIRLPVAGDVPPFGAMVWVRAVVAWEGEGTLG